MILMQNEANKYVLNALDERVELDNPTILVSNAGSLSYKLKNHTYIKNKKTSYICDIKPCEYRELLRVGLQLDNYNVENIVINSENTMPNYQIKATKKVIKKVK